MCNCPNTFCSGIQSNVPLENERLSTVLHTTYSHTHTHTHSHARSNQSTTRKTFQSTRKQYVNRISEYRMLCKYLDDLNVNSFNRTFQSSYTRMSCGDECYRYSYLSVHTHTHTIHSWKFNSSLLSAIIIRVSICVLWSMPCPTEPTDRHNLSIIQFGFQLRVAMVMLLFKITVSEFPLLVQIVIGWYESGQLNRLQTNNNWCEHTYTHIHTMWWMRLSVLHLISIPWTNAYTYICRHIVSNQI